MNTAAYAYSGWGTAGQTLTRGESRTGQTMPAVTKRVAPGGQIVQPVRATRFETSHADTPSAPPIDAYTSEGDVIIAGPSPIARALPWVAGLALLGAGVFAFTRK